MSLPHKTFIFDFDSTIFPGETLDEIIQYKLKGDPEEKEKSASISEICTLGMSGDISMEESLKRRLAIAAPDKKTIEQFVANNEVRIEVPIRGLLQKIQSKGHQLHIISGGFEEWIVPLLKGMVAAENIHANTIINQDVSMSHENIIIRSKEEIIKQLSIKKDQKTIIIGDGATDFNVFEQGMAQAFIGVFYYTGIASREKIFNKAKAKDQRSFVTIQEFVTYMDRFL